MAYNPKSKESLMPPWSKENQPPNRGRKPSSVRKFIKDNNLNGNDVSALAKYMIPLKKSQLKDLLTGEKSDKVPFIIQLFAKAMLKDMGNGNLNNVMNIMDRAVGKPQQKVKVNAAIESFLHNIDYSDLSDDDAKKLFFDKINNSEDDE